MSWSFNTTCTEPNVEAELDYAEQDYRMQSGLTFTPAVDDQIKAAAAAAVALVRSGAIGKPLKFTVGLSGHANPDHLPAEGWSNDSISVSLSAQDYPEPAESEGA